MSLFVHGSASHSTEVPRAQRNYHYEMVDGTPKKGRMKEVGLIDHIAFKIIAIHFGR